MPLSDSDLSRYQRQLIVDGWNQDKLKDACVFIAGLGGLGGTAAIYLAAAGIGHITLCDSDRVGLSNLNRQILYSTYDIGDNKAEKAKNKLKALNPSVEIRAIVDRLSESNFLHLIRDHHLIIDGLDNHEGRLLLNKASINFKIPYIYSAVNALNIQLAIFNPPETACLACLMPQEKSEARPIPIYGALPGMAAAMQVHLAIKYLMTGKIQLPDTMLLFDADSNEFEKVSFSKNPRCPVCVQF